MELMLRSASSETPQFDHASAAAGRRSNDAILCLAKARSQQAFVREAVVGNHILFPIHLGLDREQIGILASSNAIFVVLANIAVCLAVVSLFQAKIDATPSHV